MRPKETGRRPVTIGRGAHITLQTRRPRRTQYHRITDIHNALGVNDLSSPHKVHMRTRNDPKRLPISERQ